MQAPAGVFLGNGDHQPQVCLRQLILGGLIAGSDALGQLHFLVGGKQLDLADLLQVHPHGIVQGVFRRQVHRVHQVLLRDAGQVHLVPQTVHQVQAVQVGIHLQVQVAADHLDVHGVQPVINFLDLLRAQVQLFQLGVQLGSPQHSLLAALGDEGLHGGLNLFHVLRILVIGCIAAHKTAPSFSYRHSV